METNGQSFLRTPGLTKGFRANDDDNRTRNIASRNDATESVRFGATGVEIFSNFVLSVSYARI
jgi:hypothetical protein